MTTAAPPEKMMTFPVLRSETFFGVPTELPWDFAECFRARAEKNHHQTLERLAERGGLSISELWCCVTDRDCPMTNWPPIAECGKAVVDALAKWQRALSAPPAASADEREELARDIIEASVKHGPYLMPHQTAAYLAALGYRKLAPAQSVGQSAAQGVGAHPLDEVIDRLENGIGMNHTEAFVLGCKHSIEIARRVRQEHLNLIARKRPVCPPERPEG